MFLAKVTIHRQRYCSATDSGIIFGSLRDSITDLFSFFTLWNFFSHLFWPFLSCPCTAVSPPSPPFFTFNTNVGLGNCTDPEIEEPKFLVGYVLFVINDQCKYPYLHEYTLLVGFFFFFKFNCYAFPGILL